MGVPDVHDAYIIISFVYKQVWFMKIDAAKSGDSHFPETDDYDFASSYSFWY